MPTMPVAINLSKPFRSLLFPPAVDVNTSQRNDKRLLYTPSTTAGPFDDVLQLRARRWMLHPLYFESALVLESLTDRFKCSRHYQGP